MQNVINYQAKTLDYYPVQSELPNNLPFANCQDVILKKSPNQPLFLFSRKMLSQISKQYQLQFPGEVSYAVKANPNKLILQTLWHSGIRAFDVASIEEVELLRSLFENCELHYNNPIRSHDMTRMAIEDYKVKSFVVDDMTSLQALLPFASDDLEITVRFKLPHDDSAAYNFGSKFGAVPEEAIKLLTLARSVTSKSSLTFHPGSQCKNPSVYAAYVEEAAKIAELSGVALFRLNVGGGFPVAYDDENIPRVVEFFNVIHEASQKYFNEQPPQLLCEPGRAMVAACISLLVEVIHIRDNGDVFINDGVYGSLQEQFVMDSKMPLKVWREDKLIVERDNQVNIFGPTCDPTDRLSSKFSLPKDIRAGDRIEFGLMGAYGSATATRFNGFIPAEYYQVNQGYY